jgi:exosortase
VDIAAEYQARSAASKTRLTGSSGTIGERVAPAVSLAIAFLLLFGQPIAMLVRDWWTLPDAGHGLLLAPAALWLLVRSGRDPLSVPQVGRGAAILCAAVLLRYAAGLAAEQYTMRLSMIAALVGIVVYFRGTRQVLRWWLPFTLSFLAMPLPELVTQAIALPLQLEASKLGAALLDLRHVPVQVSGNVIHIPGHELFVTEACSGLRSLTALVSMSVFIGAVTLRLPASRLVLLCAAIPIAIAINGVRVFFTGFLVYFVSPALGTGFMHASEGWLLFLVSVGTLAVFALLARRVEQRFVAGARNA